MLGIYYGGTGLGITLSALGVPWVLAQAAGWPHAWAWAWWGLALLCGVATLLLTWPARVLAASDADEKAHPGVFVLEPFPGAVPGMRVR